MATDFKAKYADILIRPRITEQATLVLEANIHTFEVALFATKKQVEEAIKVFYKVNPIKIRMVKNPAKKVFIKGKKGVRAGVKKAYVYLKKGDKLE
mgnify:CR=1 FL=1